MIFSFYPVHAQIFDSGVLIVQLKDQISSDIFQEIQGHPEYLFDQTYRVAVRSLQASLAILKTDSRVEYAESDQVLRNEVVANDPLFVLDSKEVIRQWYLPKIEVHKAWEKTVGSNITIAVVDTGIFAKHQDMNDGRVIAGYSSYCQTMDTVSGNCLARVSGELSAGVNSDDNGHGTIVAGIIGAIPNNNLGISGLNWNVRLMPIKVLDAHGSGMASDVAIGIRWAVDNGAKIINLSIGGPGLEGLEVLRSAIKYAFDKGVLVIAAAGNDASIVGGNLDINQVLPVCADNAENIVIGVAALDINDKKARFSNFGSRCVDISAPGTGTFIDRQNKQGLVSTYYDPTKPTENDLYVYALGTSVAAPIVSGVAGLMISVNPDLDVRALRDRLISSVDNIDELNLTGCDGTSCVGQIGRGRINAFKAVNTDSGFTSGTMIKTPSGQIFLVDRGLKRPVSTFVYSQRFATLTITSVDQATADSLSFGPPVPPLDGTLILGDSDHTVFLLEGGQRLGLSYLAFVSRGFSFDQIIRLPQIEVIGYARGIDALILDGVLIKERGNPGIFVTQGGNRRLLSYFVFKQRGFDKRLIAEVSAQELASFPAPNPFYLYPPIDGTLIKSNSSATVYLMDNQVRRGLNLPAFENRGFKFSDIKVLPDEEMIYYQSGADIIE